MIRPTALACAVALVTALTPLTAHADEVRLKNGDRITGVTVSLAGGTLDFKAPGGELKIPWADVASLSIDQPILVSVGTAAPASATFGAIDATGHVTLVPGGPVLLTDIVSLARPQPAWIVAGGAGAGIVETSGNTQVNNVRLSADVAARNGANRYTAAAIQAHVADHGVETARNWLLSGKYDRFLSSRLYANANADFTNDAFRDIDLRTAIGAGLGYEVLNTARATLTADGGFAWVKENFKSIPDDHYAAAHEAVALQVRLIGGRAQLFHKHDGYFGVSGGNKMFFHTANGVRLGIAAGFVTTIEEDLDYDRQPSPGRKNTDRTFSLTLGYRF